MAKPVIYSLDAMSYQVDNLIPFTYLGGTIKSSSIRVSEAVNNQIVFEDTQNTASTQFNLEADSIDVTTYGTQYYIQVRVTEMDDTKSAWSDIRFATFITTPTFQFSNILENTVLKQSYFNASLLYYQLENELLHDAVFYLYDSSKNLLLASPSIYDVSNLEYNYNGFVDGIYYFRAKGETVHGYKVDTGDVKIIVDYVTPETFSNFYLVNDYPNGQIRYESNIISIDYHGDETFDFKDGYIDLTEKTLIYDRGFRVDDDCTFIIKGKDMYRSGIYFFELLDEQKKYGFRITSYIYDDESIRYKLVATNGLDNYILYSAPIAKLEPEDLVAFWIRKENNIYSFKVYITRAISGSETSNLLERLYNTSNLLKFDADGLTVLTEEEKATKWTNEDGVITGITNDPFLLCFLNDKTLGSYSHKVDVISTGADDDALVVIISARPINNFGDYNTLSLIIKLNDDQGHCGVPSEVQFALVSNLYEFNQIVLAEDLTFTATGNWSSFQKGIGIKIIKDNTNISIYRTNMRADTSSLDEFMLDEKIASPVINMSFNDIFIATGIDYRQGYIGYGNISQEGATFENIILTQSEVG